MRSATSRRKSRRSTDVSTALKRAESTRARPVRLGLGPSSAPTSPPRVAAASPWVAVRAVRLLLLADTEERRTCTAPPVGAQVLRPLLRPAAETVGNNNNNNNNNNSHTSHRRPRGLSFSTWIPALPVCRNSRAFSTTRRLRRPPRTSTAMPTPRNGWSGRGDILWDVGGRWKTYSVGLRAGPSYQSRKTRSQGFDRASAWTMVLTPSKPIATYGRFST